MMSLLKIDVPPAIWAAGDDQIIMWLLELLNLGKRAAPTRVGDTMWHLERSGIVRAALFRAGQQVWLYDYDGEAPSIREIPGC